MKHVQGSFTFHSVKNPESGEHNVEFALRGEVPVLVSAAEFAEEVKRALGEGEDSDKQDSSRAAV